MTRQVGLRTPQQIAISEAMKRHWRKRKAGGNPPTLRSGATSPSPLRSAVASKYGNRKTTVLGEKFDSKREALRHLVLRDMERMGEISGLERQVVYKLVVEGKLICKYIPDFRYRIPSPNGSHVVCEDAKGYSTRDFKIKFKLAKALFPEIEWKLS